MNFDVSPYCNHGQTELLCNLTVTFAVNDSYIEDHPG